MVERRPFLTFLAHLVLLGGVLMVALPIWITFVASTHSPAAVFRAPVPIWPGDRLLENYATVLDTGVRTSGAPPVATMMFNSLIMAIGISVEKSPSRSSRRSRSSISASRSACSASGPSSSR